MKTKKTILITGVAGFIGYHLAKKLITENHNVIGIDNLNDYYDLNLKENRLSEIQNMTMKSDFEFKKVDLCNKNDIKDIFKNNKIDLVVNLAAQAGVRYSIENPHTYIDSNIVGFVNLLECVRSNPIEQFIFASSSSIYGLNKDIPFLESHISDRPISLYAATKKSNELIAHAYSHLYDIKMVGLRFFTVYGPFGRPDMAYYKFTKLINSNKKIELYNHGNMKRDFTYVSDVIESISIMINKPIPEKKFDIYNVGNNKPTDLKYFLSIIEDYFQKKAIIKNLPMQPGDVPITYADLSKLQKDFSYTPKTSIEDGMKYFLNWFARYHSKN